MEYPARAAINQPAQAVKHIGPKVRFKRRVINAGKQLTVLCHLFHFHPLSIQDRGPANRVALDAGYWKCIFLRPAVLIIVAYCGNLCFFWIPLYFGSGESKITPERVFHFPRNGAGTAKRAERFKYTIRAARHSGDASVYEIREAGLI
jgi:hypothetical protein